MEDRLARNHQESVVVTNVKKLAVGRLATIPPTATTTLVLTKQMRCSIGKAAAANVSGAVPLSSRADLKDHPATKASLTWLYDEPKEVGGWFGAIEPEAESWIAFVATDGKVLLWEKREKNGGVTGTPVTFYRKDLVTSKVSAQQRMKCESTPLGSDAAQGRFRIFKEGTIQTDHGLSVMTPAAGRAVIKAFQARGNDMMIDLRHFSISPTATREQSEAMGWIPCPNGLEYVDGDGLYVTNVRWVPEVQAGLESDPPKWKYFSPLYNQDKKTKVITSLDNVALTNMPATHRLNRLAAERSGPMDLKTLGALMLALSIAADADNENAKAWLAQLTAGLGDQAQAALDAANADAAPDSVDGEDMLAGMSEDEKAIVASMPEAMKATYMAGKKAMSASVAVEADKEVAAESDKKNDAVAAEADKLACGFDLDTLNKIAAGEDAQNINARKTMVDNAVKAGLVSKSMAAILMDPSKTTEQVAAEFIAGRRTRSVTVGGPIQQRMGAPDPKTKRDEYPGVSKEDRIAAEALSKKTGTPVEELLANMVDKG